MRLLKFSILFVLLGAFGLHEYYVSVFRLSYNAQENQIQAEVKVFTDDLEQLLKTNDHIFFKMDEAVHSDELEESIQKELLNSFGYKDSKGRDKAITFMGYENEGDITWLYFTIDNVRSVKGPTLSINWMTDLFPGQVNIVHFFDGIDERSEFFSQEKTQIQFDFYE